MDDFIGIPYLIVRRGPSLYNPPCTELVFHASLNPLPDVIERSCRQYMNISCKNNHLDMSTKTGEHLKMLNIEKESRRDLVISDSIVGSHGLLGRLQNGGSVVVAEGYLFEFERSGYLSAGAFVPEVILDYPHLVKQKYEEFVHAGSDVVLAFTYNGQREKLRVIGREAETQAMNTSSLKMAREVADEHGCLMAGNICNSTVYVPNDEKISAYIESMFKEQIELAVKYGADYIVGETYCNLGEAKLALDCIKTYGEGLPAVITMSASAGDVTAEGLGIVEALKELEDAGAAVVGLNCARGPDTMMPLLRKLKTSLKVPLAALPVTYRTTPIVPCFQGLKIPGTDKRAFPLDLCACVCSRQQIEEFAREAYDLGIQYVGLCCGNSGSMTRIVAETYGRVPPASRYRPRMEQHFIFGDKTRFNKYHTEHIANTKAAFG